MDPRSPVVVGRSLEDPRNSERGQEVHWEVWEGLGGPPGSLGGVGIAPGSLEGVGRVPRKSMRGREGSPEVLECSGGPPEVRKGSKWPSENPGEN